MLPRAARALASSSPRVPLLSRLRIVDGAAAFAAAGFDPSPPFHIGGVAVDLIGGGAANGWAWKNGASHGSERVSLDGIDTEIDGFLVMQQSLQHERGQRHPNGALGLYSLTVVSADLERTMRVFAAPAGLGAPRRVAEPSPFSPDLSMAFYKAGSATGDVIIEVVAPRRPGTAVRLGAGLPPIGADRDAPAYLGGMVVVVPDLASLSDVLGADRVGKARPAVQGQGRMIAPARHDALGLSLSLAFITPPDPAALQSRAKRGAQKGLATVLTTNAPT